MNSARTFHFMNPGSSNGHKKTRKTTISGYMAFCPKISTMKYKISTKCPTLQKNVFSLKISTSALHKQKSSFFLSLKKSPVVLFKGLQTNILHAP